MTASPPLDAVVENPTDPSDVDREAAARESKEASRALADLLAPIRGQLLLACVLRGIAAVLAIALWLGKRPTAATLAMLVAGIAAMLALGLHLHHGVWSACQTLGFTNSAKARGWAKTAAAIIAGVVVIGFLIPPLAIQLHLIK